MKMARSGAAIPGMPAMPGMPGMPAMPGMSGAGSKKPPIPNKKKSKSGNPAKRAAEEGR
jgi:signal recognition particle subunit SRP54